MSRILLADDSPHAQRMGELILREEGYEVVTITDGATALVRLRDVDPDLILVDVLMPTRSGYEICEYVKSSLRHLHTRVVLLAGELDPVDEQEARRVHADGLIKKPFEASTMIETLKPLLAAAAAARSERPSEAAEPEPAIPDDPEPVSVASGPAGPSPELIRAAVTIALDAVLPSLIEEITQKVLFAIDRNAA
jgi:CheY-like chemotaxis protein